MPVPTSTVYQVDQDVVRVEVEIGDGQTGSSVLFLGPQEVARGGRMVRKILGRGNDLRGLVLVVSTTVVDVRPQHDRVSVRVLLGGGVPDPMPIVQGAIVKPSEAENFLFVVRFI